MIAGMLLRTGKRMRFPVAMLAPVPGPLDVSRGGPKARGSSIVVVSQLGVRYEF